MNAFTDKEVAYLGEQRIGRLATVDGKGRPHVVPAGFNLDADKGVLEIGAHDLPDRGQRRLYMSRSGPIHAWRSSWTIW